MYASALSAGCCDITCCDVALLRAIIWYAVGISLSAFRVAVAKILQNPVHWPLRSQLFRASLKVGFRRQTPRILPYLHRNS